MIVIALDLGTSGCKGYLITLEGKIIKSMKVDYPTYYEANNIVEQCPLDWIKAVKKCLKILCKKKSIKEDIIGICVDATVGTLVPIERWGVASTKRVPLYSDMRAINEVEFIKERFGARYIYNKTGNPLTPVPTLVKMMWYKKYEKRIYEKTKKFIFHKDYIVENLIDETEPFTDYTDASATMAYDIRKKEWISEILEETGIPLDKLPEVKESREIAGGLSKKIANEIGIKSNIPVSVGAGDCAATLYGAGAVENMTGDVYIGTAPEIDLTLEELKLDPKFRIPIRCHAIKNQWYSTATTISGYSINWFLNQIIGKNKISIEALNEKCKKIPAGSNGLLYLPYIIGERVPILDPFARAAFIGLDINHRIEHMYRAILEGISFALRENLEVYQKDMNIKIKYLSFSGGGAENILMRKIIASNLKMKISLIENSVDCAAIGNAMLFLTSLGEYKDIKEASKRIVKVIGEEDSDTELSKVYDEYYLIYKEAYKKLKNLFIKLRKFRSLK
ncbi:MAG: FGGY family carbohydrate kinase [Nitrososphaerota archaeon]